MYKNKYIIISLIIILILSLFINKNKETFYGYDETKLPSYGLYGSYGAPSRPTSEYLTNYYLKHAIINPRSRIILLSPTPPLTNKTNCHQIKCPNEIIYNNLTCWYCNGYG